MNGRRLETCLFVREEGGIQVEVEVNIKVSTVDCPNCPNSTDAVRNAPARARQRALERHARARDSTVVPKVVV